MSHSIPMISLPAQGWPEETNGGSVAQRTYGILVVDDEPGVRGLLGIGLQQQGFSVWLAANGREAHALYLQHRQTIDVVLLDVHMPGLDGPGTWATLQALNPELHCCFMSGDFGRYSEGQLQDFGAAGVFRKPFQLLELANTLLKEAQEARLR